MEKPNQKTKTVHNALFDIKLVRKDCTLLESVGRSLKKDILRFKRTIERVLGRAKPETVNPNNIEFNIKTKTKFHRNR